MTIYQPPDPPEVEETICIKVLIPAGQKYISAFWSAYTYFGKWVAWEKDGSDTAKRAADLWRGLIEQSREMFDNGEDCEVCEDSMEVRQNPTNPCILEYNTGEGWLEFADLDLCKGTDQNRVPVWADPPTDTQKAQYLANNLEMITQMFTGMYPGINQTTQTNQWNTNSNIRNALGSSYWPMFYAVNQFLSSGVTQTEINTLKSNNSQIYKDIIQAIACGLDDDGWWLDDMSDAIFEFLDALSGKVYEGLQIVTGNMTPNIWYTVGAGGAGFTGPDYRYFPDGLECTFTAYFDFTIDDYSEYWTAILGSWVSGQGYVSQLHEDPGASNGWEQAVQVRCAFGGEYTITRVTMTFVNPDTGDFWQENIDMDDSHYHEYPYGTSPVEWTGEDLTVFVDLACQNHNEATNCRVLTCEIEGNAPSPF